MSTTDPAGRRWPPDAVARAALAGAVAVLIVAFVQGALADGGAVGRWLPVAVGALAAAALAVRATTNAADRGAWGIMAAAIAVYTLGSVHTAISGAGSVNAASPFADAYHVAFYPLMYVGLVQMLRQRVAGFATALWLDGLIGAVAVAAVGTGIVLPPALDSAAAERADLITRMIFPLGDMLLLAFVVGVMALNRWRPGRAWIVLGAGFAALALGHGAQLSAAALGTGASGVPELMWPLALAIVAFAAWHPSDLRPDIRLDGWSLLVAPTLFGWVTVGLVAYGNFARLGAVGLALAVITLLLVMVRAALTFRENAALAAGLRPEPAEADRDALTGLANHRAFHEALDRAAEEARLHDRPLSVAIIDIDDFRSVNRMHGHQAGDAVLAEIARRISATLRGEDLLARVGGEEFACLMPATTSQAGWRAAERARQVIESEPFPGVGRITISAGVCDLSMAEDERELVRLANGALYWAKIHGRNVVYRYAPEVMDVLSADERADLAERSRTLSAITALARAVDAKDATTQRHSERVGALASALAGSLGWSPDRRAKLHEAGLVHDVGKIGVPDTILRKNAPLTAAEAEVMEGHAALGARIVQDVLSAEQALWVLHHHERWDGEGYPHRLGGEDIPEGAQILAVADAWDAMTADRHYREAMPPRQVIDAIVAGGGTQWSPRVVDALLAMWDAGRLAPAARAPWPADPADTRRDRRGAPVAVEA